MYCYGPWVEMKQEPRNAHKSQENNETVIIIKGKCEFIDTLIEVQC